MKPRAAVCTTVMICLLFAPAATFGKKGEKNFRQGIKYEANQLWDRAVQEFVLAVANDPSNMEYQLHYRRALFHASQSCMQQGRALADRHDYVGAYNSFRQAYAYDGVNQLAVSEMQRMVRLQEESKGSPKPTRIEESSPAFAPTAYHPGQTAPEREVQDGALPRPERIRVISYSGDLESFITSLADQLSLNVVFDKQSFSQPRNLRINLRNVTTAKALDLIFLKEGLFFQKVDRRTILVADNSRRPQFQQLVLRTFYFSSIEPQDAQKIVQAAIPPSAGRPQTMVVADKSTNSLTVRDTAENIRLIGELIKSVDKDRSEVVMDVQIYEVSATDLLQVGNQLGTDTTLASLGGTSNLSVIGASRQVAEQVFPATTALGAALVLPSSRLSLLQKKNRTRVLASTQMHAFDGEKSEVHIGQRVPVQTAQVLTGTTAATSSTTATGVYANVINYEPTGLTLEFTPQVYPNLDVQVKMSIKSNDVTVADPLTPTFTERTLSGTARIQNNQTMMIASVSTNQQSQGRSGLPLVGLVPVLGRLFTAPSKDGKQTDIVVAVTPRVLRAPAITPRDEEARPAGSWQAPMTESLEAVVAEADREDQIAAARIIPTRVNIKLPDQETATYVPAPKSLVGNPGTVIPSTLNVSVIQGALLVEEVSSQPSPFTDAKAQLLSLSNNTDAKLSMNRAAELVLVTDHDRLRAGEKMTVKLMLKTEEMISFAAVRLKFDPSVMKIQNISAGGLYQNAATPQIAQSPGKPGELAVLISGATTRGSGVLLTFTVEARNKGELLIELNGDAVHLITPEGRDVAITRLGEARAAVE
jgi:general secretion pathway protein D